MQNIYNDAIFTVGELKVKHPVLENNLSSVQKEVIENVTYPVNHNPACVFYFL